MGLTAWDELQLWVAFTTFGCIAAFGCIATFGCIAASGCNFPNHREEYAPDKTSGFAVDYI